MLENDFDEENFGKENPKQKLFLERNFFSSFRNFRKNSKGREKIKEEKMFGVPIVRWENKRKRSLR